MEGKVGEARSEEGYRSSAAAVTSATVVIEEKVSGKTRGCMLNLLQPVGVRSSAWLSRAARENGTTAALKVDDMQAYSWVTTPRADTVEAASPVYGECAQSTRANAIGQLQRRRERLVL